MWSDRRFTRSPSSQPRWLQWVSLVAVVAFLSAGCSSDTAPTAESEFTSSGRRTLLHAYC